MTKEQAEKQAKELIQIIKDSGVKKIKVNEMNVIDLPKFLNTHESRLNFLETFSREWKIHYFRLYLLKKKLSND
ncbi:hypothetical protein OAE03_01470 [Winogradskyella sp.]|nr:hypothetical protein [Winogradskyella sp.]MDC0009207.1 hypothetical protein [Winogradskyella sp.]